MPTANSRNFVSADPNKCNGCSICELVCALEKENHFEPSLSRIKVVRLIGVLNFTSACRFCDNPPCVEACGRKALQQSVENGAIIVEETKCDGCGWCIEACEYGAIRLHPNKTSVLICDLCKGEPKCVQWCPEGALELRSTKDLNTLLNQAITGKLLG